MGDPAERSEVRAEGRRARRAVCGNDRDKAEAALVAHLRSLVALDAPTVGVFLAHDGEPNLESLIVGLRSRGQTVALPVLADDPNDFSMRFVPWPAGTPLHKGRYGISVPPDAAAIEPDTLLVPFTGFDTAGHRIGRGAGFFDRYLAGCESELVGVGFEAQRFDHVPTEAHDRTLPVVVTDLGVRFVPCAA